VKESASNAKYTSATLNALKKKPKKKELKEEGSVRPEVDKTGTLTDTDLGRRKIVTGTKGTVWPKKEREGSKNPRTGGVM